MNYHAIVIGSSAGGLQALKTIISGLSPHFKIPIIICQHRSPYSDSFMVQFLNELTPLLVKEADEKELITERHIYLAPPNFHLLVEEDFSLSLTVEEKVNFARPSIDVLFETAAEAYQHHLIGVILTGANHDGAKGMMYIQKKGGLTIAQNPATAEVPIMPQTAISSGCIDYVVNLEEIAELLNKLCKT
ncbi:MAG: chemotaxis protein CheB [Bacteroidetes bacterium]|nr:chemotaxis protein CheB [Bacteroidota bacterium]MBU1578955.1 chemotaxis protein CheB [Bacteroidota bacterium]MBU2556432.1 chemotaxis protein CheB [Bacteroidota bacterium]